MMQRQGHEHNLLKWKADDWWIRKGNYIALAEMLYFGGRTCSCFDLYHAYVSLPTFICKRYHSVSNTGGATKRRNAKGLRFQESGKWGLPRRF